MASYHCGQRDSFVSRQVWPWPGSSGNRTV